MGIMKRCQIVVCVAVHFVLATGTSQASEPLRTSFSDDLVCVILQFTMYDKEAHQTLSKDSQLRRFLDLTDFVTYPGVYVTGAGIQKINGFYKKTGRLPGGKPYFTHERFHAGLPGYVISFHRMSGEWCLRDFTKTSKV